MKYQQNSTLVCPRFVCGLYMNTTGQRRNMCEHYARFMQAYIHIDLLLLETTRGILKDIISCIVSHRDIYLQDSEITDCLEFLEQTREIFGTPRKDARKKMQLQ